MNKEQRCCDVVCPCARHRGQVMYEIVVDGRVVDNSGWVVLTGEEALAHASAELKRAKDLLERARIGWYDAAQNRLALLADIKAFLKESGR